MINQPIQVHSPIMKPTRLRLNAWWQSALAVLVGVALAAGGQPPAKSPEKTPAKNQAPDKRRVQEEDDTKAGQKAPAKDAKPADQEKKPVPEKPGSDDKAQPPSDDKAKTDEKPGESPFEKSSAAPAGTTESLKPGPFNLAEEARKATHPEIKKLLESFASATDIITTDSGKVYHCTPLAKKYDPQTSGTLTFRTVDGKTLVLPRPQIKEVSQYETRALSALDAFLDRRLENESSAKISRFEQLRAAEKVLTEVSTFHSGAISQATRDPASWTGVKELLAQRLFAVRIDQLRALQAARDFATGGKLAAILFQEAPGNRALLDAIEQFYVAQVDQSLRARKYLEARLTLEFLRSKFRNPLSSTLARRVVEQLEDYARDHLDKAKTAVQSSDRSIALAALEKAEEAWPTYPGLRELREKLLGEYAVLRVGVRAAPRNLSPMTAMTESEKMASRLLFEPLIVARAAPSSAEGFRPVLADTPRRLVNGYEFSLPNGLSWSDGQPVKADDVLRSLELVSTPGTPLFDPAKANNELFTARALDESRIAFTFTASMLDPVAQLTFPILPAHRLPRERSALDPAFDKQPVGTGPFMLVGLEGDEMVLRANPHFKRPWATQGPRIKEIRFIPYNDFQVAKKAFLDGRWQLLLDATSKEVEELTGQPQAVIFTPTEPKSNQLTNARIYLLAINHRNPALQNEKAREAIYYAIDRNRILDTLFRGKNTQQHQVLNGPFPLSSWAYDINAYNPVANSPYQQFKASAARNTAGSLPDLKLVVMAEDTAGVAACGLIKEDLAKANINATVIPMPSQALFLELQKEQPNFDLLYTTYDFANESLSLQPLLDREAIGDKGQNFMGYQSQQPDNTLMQLFRTSQSSRDFSFAQKQMFAIHDHVVKNAIFVPLYQLDRHVAVHRSLDNYSRFHPQYIFDGVESWTLKAVK